MKKLLSVLLVLAMILTVMTGCGSKTDPGQGAEDAQSQGTAEDPITITYSTFRAEDEAIFKELITKFETENPGIKVKFDTNPDTNTYYTSLKANLQAGEGPDVFDCHPMFDFVVFANEGMALDMSDMEFVKNYTDSAKDLTSVDGKVYGYSHGVNLICMLYDIDVFQEKGYEIPATWDDFVALTQQMKTDGFSGVAYCGATTRSNWLQGAMFNEVMGGEAYKALLEGIDSGDVATLIDNEDFMLACETMSQYNKQNIFYENTFNIDFTQSISIFAQKKTPILTMGTWIYGSRENDLPGINFGIFPLPTLKGTDIAYAESGQISMINANSKQIDAAKKWVEFLATPENASIYISSSKYCPTINGVEANFDGAELLAAQMEKGVAILPIINRKNFEFYTDNWTAMLENIIINGKDPVEEVKAFESALKALDLKNVK